MGMDVRGLARSRLRRVVLPVFARVNPGDITIRNPRTHDKLRLHSFKHRGYWFHGRTREQVSMELFARCLEPGDVVLEVGGHIGFVTQYFSNLVGPRGRVVVFEPGPNNLPYLHRNVDGLANVTIVEAAAGADEGEAVLYVEELTGQNNSLVQGFTGLADNEKSAGVSGHVAAVSTPITVLDAHVPDSGVDLVKIDVEGFELEVLRGAERTLAVHRPVLMVEIQRNEAELIDLAEGHGYEVFDEALRPLGARDLVGRTGNTFWFHRVAHAELLARLHDSH
jgi:FkbM family methyltransferase